MPYKTVAELPDTVDDLPEHGKEIYLNAFNSAFEQYKDRGEQREALAHATAWAAVKRKYAKGDDGHWHAKEAATLPDLRQAYSELCLEYGRRNARADAQRIRQIMELCQELLEPAEEEADTEREEARAQRAEEALTEVREAISWLQGLPLDRVEDGQVYPVEAYAYVPDPGKPATWKVRLWESTDLGVTKAQLARAAASLTSGGYNGERADIPPEAVPLARTRIREAYRQIGITEDQMPKSLSDMERTLVAEYIPLSEATVQSNDIARVRLIRAGLNKSKERYYPPAMLQRDYKVFEGVKMYADHPTADDDRLRPERSVRDWVATLRNVQVDGDELVGEAVVIEPWLKERLATLRDKGMMDQIGISINAIGSGVKGEIEGVKTNIIERIVRARSVDFVTEAGAGGSVMLFENASLDVDLIGLDTLRERRPDLIQEAEARVRQVMSKEVQKVNELEQRVQELEGTLATVTAERDVLQGQIAEAEKAAQIAETRTAVEGALAESQLPEPARIRILERYADATSADGLEDAIAAEAEYIGKITEAGKVKHLGGSRNDPKVSREALKQEFIGMGMTEAQAEIAVSGR